ncbi:hypothetical protein F5B20DRAFT_519868 [Whalleya microplaca]|nr:hypothetical protein F5B20DRAFT_519868 [Whalleya microplaca]
MMADGDYERLAYAGSAGLRECAARTLLAAGLARHCELRKVFFPTNLRGTLSLARKKQRNFFVASFLSFFLSSRALLFRDGGTGVVGACLLKYLLGRFFFFFLSVPCEILCRLPPHAYRL